MADYDYREAAKERARQEQVRALARGHISQEQIDAAIRVFQSRFEGYSPIEDLHIYARHSSLDYHGGARLTIVSGEGCVRSSECRTNDLEINLDLCEVRRLGQYLVAMADACELRRDHRYQTEPAPSSTSI